MWQWITDKIFGHEIVTIHTAVRYYWRLRFSANSLYTNLLSNKQKILFSPLMIILISVILVTLPLESQAVPSAAPLKPTQDSSGGILQYKTVQILEERNFTKRKIWINISPNVENRLKLQITLQKAASIPWIILHWSSGVHILPANWADSTKLTVSKKSNTLFGKELRHWALRETFLIKLYYFSLILKWQQKK